MAYKVIYSDNARLQLASILHYWCDECNSVGYAGSLMSKFDDLVERLADFPRLYRTIDGLDLDEETRIAVVDNYIVLYRIDDSADEVIIGRIVIGKSNYLRAK